MIVLGVYSLNSRDLFLNLRILVKMTKPLRFENKSLRLKYKCLICIWIIFWAILDLFINPKYLFQNKSFSQTYYFKSEKSFVILTSLLGLKINPGNLESTIMVPPPPCALTGLPGGTRVKSDARWVDVAKLNWLFPLISTHSGSSDHPFEGSEEKKFNLTPKSSREMVIFWRKKDFIHQYD